LILVSPGAANKLHAILLKSMMRAPQSYFSATDTGILVNMFSQDMTQIEMGLAVGCAVFLSSEHFPQNEWSDARWREDKRN